MDTALFRAAAESVAGQQVSIEPDGTVWADADGRVIDSGSVVNEYERLVAEQSNAREAAVAKLAALGLTVDDLTALGL